jgi:hypothetical protein
MSWPAPPIRHGHARKHGLRTPEYDLWANIKQRCCNPNSLWFAYYGARGILICSEWYRSFEAFLEHVGKRPSPLHTLDRKDNSKGYFPGNVRWATRKVQQRNQRGNRMLEFGGQRHCVAEWCEITGLSRKLIDKRLRLDWPVEKILTTQPMNR